MTTENPSAPGRPNRLFKIATPLLVLAIGGLAAWQITNSAPKASRHTPQPQPRLVETQAVIQKDIHVTVSGLGTVIPSQQLTLYPEVSGQIEQLRAHLMPGSQIKKGEILIGIDAAEYQIQVQKQQAAVALAQAELQKEMGQQAIAQQEYELIGRPLTPAQKALVLRQPELASAKAKLTQAQADLKEAKLNLERTNIKAPFNAQLINRSVETGSQLSTSTELMNIVATDEFWLELEIPAEQLAWLEFGQKDSVVTLSSPAWQGSTRTGRLLSFSPELSSGSRMAKVIVAIHDPLALNPENQGAPKVLLNDMVRAELTGKQVDHAVVIPDALIHSGNQVWVYSKNQTLEIRTITPVYRDNQKTIITEGLHQGDQLVTSNLSAPVNGMRLRTDSTAVANDKQRSSNNTADTQKQNNQGEPS